MEPNDDKLRELILHIAIRSEGDVSFGITKLHMDLFYADFSRYAHTGKSITGQTYRRLSQGPKGSAAERLVGSMQQDGDLELLPRTYHGWPQQKPIGRREPDLSLFSAEEIALVDGIISEFWGRNGEDVKGLSGEYVGWRVTEEGEVIPYETALVDTGPITEDEEAWLSELASSGR